MIDYSEYSIEIPYWQSLGFIDEERHPYPLLLRHFAHDCKQLLQLSVISAAKRVAEFETSADRADRYA